MKADSIFIRSRLVKSNEEGQLMVFSHDPLIHPEYLKPNFFKSLDKAFDDAIRQSAGNLPYAICPSPDRFNRAVIIRSSHESPSA